MTININDGIANRKRFFRFSSEYVIKIIPKITNASLPKAVQKWRVGSHINKPKTNLKFLGNQYLVFCKNIQLTRLHYYLKYLSLGM